MTAKEMWNAYCEQRPEAMAGAYDIWNYGNEEMSDILAERTLIGTKTAVSSAFPMCIYENKDLPKEGDYKIVMNSSDEAVCIIQTTLINIIPFHQVDALQAFKEGEGDLSLNYWRTMHQQYFTEELERVGQVFTEDMLVICEEFQVVYPPEE